MLSILMTADYAAALHLVSFCDSDIRISSDDSRIYLRVYITCSKTTAAVARKSNNILSHAKFSS